jgi:hypothetical protein
MHGTPQRCGANKREGFELTVVEVEERPEEYTEMRVKQTISRYQKGESRMKHGKSQRK